MVEFAKRYCAPSPSTDPAGRASPWCNTSPAALVHKTETTSTPPLTSALCWLRLFSCFHLLVIVPALPGVGCLLFGDFRSGIGVLALTGVSFVSWIANHNWALTH